ncbi:FAD:protein FMN transferase [Polaribacter sp.]|uniref:FAD:protein FMN transferase n=1 Tax=Polaribacter sp. TaxID=1920175 RepID=UPI003F6CD3A7
MKGLYFLIIFSTTLLFFSCKKEVVLSDYSLRGAVFGTTYKITYLNAATNYQKEIDSLFLKMNNSLSTYIPNSAISKINKGDTTVVVDDYFVEVFKKSKRIFKETHGYFDPTVGNLVNAWGFGPKNIKRDLTDEEVRKEMQFVGLQMVTLKNNQIKKKYNQIYLDFNSIAKGYGIDVVARFLEKQNIHNYLVEIGGEIRTKGLKEENKPWVVKLVDPINTETGFKKINLSNKSMATSGNYRKFRITDSGKKFVHTINPITGLATESNLLSASVIASLDCADVDAYATAFMAMGLEKTKSFLKNNPQLKVVLLYINKENKLEEFSNYTYD